jgi:hypothetical protein
MRLDIVRRLEALEGPQDSLGQLQRQRQVDAVADDFDERMERLVERMQAAAIEAGFDLDAEAVPHDRPPKPDRSWQRILDEINEGLAEGNGALERWVRDG